MTLRVRYAANTRNRQEFVNSSFGIWKDSDDAVAVARPGFLKWVGSAKGVGVQGQGVWGTEIPQRGPGAEPR